MLFFNETAKSVPYNCAHENGRKPGHRGIYYAKYLGRKWGGGEWPLSKKKDEKMKRGKKNGGELHRKNLQNASFMVINSTTRGGGSYDNPLPTGGASLQLFSPGEKIISGGGE